MNAEIVAIGSELLLGQIVDTNSARMAQRLGDLGVNLFYKTVAGDNPGRMLEVTNRAMDRSDLVITSGGLGPTQDDLPKRFGPRLGLIWPWLVRPDPGGHECPRPAPNDLAPKQLTPALGRLTSGG